MVPVVAVIAAGDWTAEHPPPIVLEVRNGKIVSDATVIKVVQGDQVEIVWTSDQTITLHLHGYDIETSVAAGQAMTMSFEAYATGRFPITSHGHGGQDHGHATLIYLEVHPR